VIIAVNGKSLDVAEKGGAVKVAISLIRHIALAKPDLELHVFVPCEPGSLDQDYPANVKFHYSPSRLVRSQAGRAVWEQICLPFMIRNIGKFELLLNLTNTAPVIVPVGIPQVLLVHDLGFMNTEWFSKSFSLYTKFVVRTAAASDATLVSVSKSTAKEIVDKIPKAKHVQAIWNAIDEPPSDLPNIGFQSRYIIFLGNINPRKNIKGAVEGFQIIAIC